MDTATVAIFAGGAATVGWIYTARRTRHNSRKQHTVTVLLQIALNDKFHKDYLAIVPSLRDNNIKDKILVENNEPIKVSLSVVLGMYEFVAAGVRNGDLDERLVSDFKRTEITTVAKLCDSYITHLRRKNSTTYEHLLWLCARWNQMNRKKCPKFAEWLIERPLRGKRN
jgi:Domain of unknown function (DUF4760)